MISQRVLSDWISTYLKYTENTEPPVSYHLWSAISMIAGALQRKVYLRAGHHIIYPNMYVVLVGPSGGARKGTALKITKDILNNIGINMTSESITREALIKDMKDAISTFTDASSGKIKYHCSMTALSEELSVLLGQNDVKFLADLTDWYDSADSWTYRTKGAGTDKINGVCFNLLGATAPDWLQSILPQEAVGGGFTSRIIFVTEEKKGKSVADESYTETEVKIREELIADLEKIVTLSGEITMTPDAKEFYINWYKQHDKDMIEGRPIIDDPRFSGYLERRATHLRKLSIIMSVSRSMSRKIEISDIKRADEVLRITEKKMPNTFGGLGRSQYGEITDRVIRYIKDRREVTRSQLLQRMYRDVDPQTLDIIETTMVRMKIIKVKRDIINDEVIYIAK